MARRSYLQRIAEPLRSGDPVMFAVPRPPPGEARAAAGMPSPAPQAPATRWQTLARRAPAVTAASPDEAATRLFVPEPTARAADGVAAPPSPLSASPLPGSPVRSATAFAPETVAGAKPVTIAPPPAGEAPPANLDVRQRLGRATTHSHRHCRGAVGRASASAACRRHRSGRTPRRRRDDRARLRVALRPHSGVSLHGLEHA